MKKTYNRKIGSRRRRHAFCAAAFVTAATVFTLAANAGLAALESSGLRIDTSKEQYTLLTDETKSILAGLSNDVHLYYTGSTDLDDLRVTQLLKSYAAASPHVFYRLVDPSMNPGFTQLFDPQQTGIENGSVIVSERDGFASQTPGRFEVLKKDDLYVFSPPYYNERGDLVSDYQYFRAEQKVTSAIDFMITDQNLRAVFLSGQEEKQPSETLVSDLNGLFYDSRVSDLNDTPLNPACDMLIVISPQRDLSEETYNKIEMFLEQGGKGMFFIDSVKPEIDNTAEQPDFDRFDKLLLSFGLFAQRNVIVGADPAHTYMSRMSIVPSLSQDSPVTQPLMQNGLNPVLTDAGVITVSYIDGVETHVLMETDASSYAKTAAEALDGCIKQPDDMAGPFVIGVLAKKTDAQIALFGSSSPVSTEWGYGIPGNRRLFLNTLTFLSGRQESNIIPMRTIYAASDNAYKLNISSEFDKLFYIGLTAVALPLAVLIIGISKWYRRRHL